MKTNKDTKFMGDVEIDVWRVTLSDSANPCYYGSLKEVADSLVDMAEGMEEGNRITITQERMLESEFEKLPDWEP